MKKLTVGAAMLIALGLAMNTTIVLAQDKAEIKFSRDNIQAERKEIVKTNIKLTPEEAGKFWPIYEAYRAAHRVIDDKRVKLIQDFVARYQDMNEEGAAQIIESFFKFKTQKLKVQTDHIDKFRAVLSTKKVARYYQVEHLMDTRLDYELFKEFPLIK
jgi:hypothetical protein